MYPSYGNPKGRSKITRSQQILAVCDWGSNPSAWEYEERDHQFGTPINFSYRYDDNGNPILLVFNIHGFQKYKYSRVEFNQTLTHLHHTGEHGIKLPNDFDMNYYKSLNNPARIAYGKKMVPRAVVINYQNELAKKLIPLYNPNTKSYEGYAGRQKRDTRLVLTPVPESWPGNKPPPGVANKDHYLGIVREDGLHISTFPISNKKLLEIAQDKFWVLQDRNL